jgi:hypothetical protein
VTAFDPDAWVLVRLQDRVRDATMLYEAALERWEERRPGENPYAAMRLVRESVGIK